MGDDDARRLILARRARFVAAALAGVAATASVAASTEACGGDVEQTDTDGGPKPCLSGPSGQADAAPQPCLDPPIEEDAEAPNEDAATTDADAEPQPCLFAPLDGG
jgi:hypothetical protein